MLDEETTVRFKDGGVLVATIHYMENAMQPRYVARFPRIDLVEEDVLRQIADKLRQLNGGGTDAQENQGH